MVEIYLAAVGGRALVLGLFSRKLRDVPLSGPLLAMAVGVVLGPAVAGVAEIPAAERDACSVLEWQVPVTGRPWESGLTELALRPAVAVVVGLLLGVFVAGLSQADPVS